MIRIVGAVAAVVVLAAGIWLLRDETMSTHEDLPDGWVTEVVLDVDTHLSEAGQTTAELARAKLLVCRTEVRNSDPTTFEAVDDAEPGTFRAVLSPGLDPTDQIQLRGCLEDWNLDHVLIEVDTMTTGPAEEVGRAAGRISQQGGPSLPLT